MVGFSYKASEYDSLVANTAVFTLDPLPKRSDWQCYLFGDADQPGPGDIVFIPTKGNEPNWFHRKMQELCFGVQWRKRK